MSTGFYLLDQFRPNVPPMPKGAPGVAKSDEHRAKIAAALKGKPKADEHRQAISAARRGQYDLNTWTPQKSRDVVHRATRRGDLAKPSACVFDATHVGPFEYDHCGEPPYSFENRLVVQQVCRPCHVRLSTERRSGAGYRKVQR